MPRSYSSTIVQPTAPTTCAGRQHAHFYARHAERPSMDRSEPPLARGAVLPQQDRGRICTLEAESQSPTHLHRKLGTSTACKCHRVHPWHFPREWTARIAKTTGMWYLDFRSPGVLQLHTWEDNLHPRAVQKSAHARSLLPFPPQAPIPAAK